MPTTSSRSGDIRAATERLFAKRNDTNDPDDRIFWATIPNPTNFTGEERDLYESGEYPIRLARHLPEHEDLLDYLIDRSIESWTRSQG